VESSPEDDEVGEAAPAGEAADGEAQHRQAAELTQEGRFAEAEPLYRAIVRRVKQTLGKDHPGHGAALYELSRVLSAQSKHAEAEGLLRRALAIFAVAPGVTAPPYEQALATLAGVLGAQDKFPEAEVLLREALAQQEKALGPDHPSLGPTLTNLAIALVQEQRLTDAEPVVARSLRIAEESHGEAHAETARILTISAQIQAALGKEEAPATARRALNALVATHGAEHPLVQDVRPILEDIAEPSAELDAIMEQAASALEERDADRAIALLTPVVDRARQDGLLPLEASASGMLAQALFVTGKKPAALALAHRALAIAEEAGQDDAVRHFRDLAEVMEQNEPGEAPDVVNAQIQAAIELATTGDVEAAVRSLDQLAEDTQAAGAAGPEATVRIVLAQILQAAGDPELASVHLRRALLVAEQLGDPGAADHIRGMLEPTRGGAAAEGQPEGQPEGQSGGGGQDGGPA
jgi:tetratricopeptide (TPR) repeat protein